MAMPIETIDPSMPSALPRSSRGKASVMMAKPSAKIMAAPRPWTIRKPMRNPTRRREAAEHRAKREEGKAGGVDRLLPRHVAETADAEGQGWPE